MDSPHKGPVMREVFPWQDVIMTLPARPLGMDHHHTQLYPCPIDVSSWGRYCGDAAGLNLEVTIAIGGEDPTNVRNWCNGVHYVHTCTYWQKGHVKATVLAHQIEIQEHRICGSKWCALETKWDYSGLFGTGRDCSSFNVIIGTAVFGAKLATPVGSWYDL